MQKINLTITKKLRKAKDCKNLTPAEILNPNVEVKLTGTFTMEEAELLYSIVNVVAKGRDKNVVVNYEKKNARKTAPNKKP